MVPDVVVSWGPERWDELHAVTNKLMPVATNNIRNTGRAKPIHFIFIFFNYQSLAKPRSNGLF